MIRLRRTMAAIRGIPERAAVRTPAPAALGRAMRVKKKIVVTTPGLDMFAPGRTGARGMAVASPPHPLAVLAPSPAILPCVTASVLEGIICTVFLRVTLAVEALASVVSTVKQHAAPVTPSPIVLHGHDHSWIEGRERRLEHTQCASTCTS
jgi:hypothetical protein